MVGRSYILIILYSMGRLKMPVKQLVNNRESDNVKRPSDMIRAKKYNRCGCGVHGVHDKPKDSNPWTIRNAIRVMRKWKNRFKRVSNKQ